MSCLNESKVLDQIVQQLKPKVKYSPKAAIYSFKKIKLLLI